jgi:hypothetical protein
MVKFTNLTHAMQAVINGKHYLVTKDKDFSEEEAELISKHLGLVLEGKSSKQQTVTTSDTLHNKKNK